MKMTKLSLSYRLLFIIGLLVLWVIALFILRDPLPLFSEYWYFFPLGIGGAVAANSTGAGGGIVFIPAFTSLGISDMQSLGTSLAIQCFGMTMGSLSWLFSIYSKQHGGAQVIHLTHRLLLLSGLPAMAGMLAAQYLLPIPALPISTLFKFFSILFGNTLLFITLRKSPHRHTRYHIRQIDSLLIGIVSLLGGMVTSWISVGAGEWVALILFFLGFPTMVAVCVAVCISSLTVLAGIPYHLLVTHSVSTEIILFAAPGALLGGFVARYLAEQLGPVRLKVFFAAWILATGLAM